MTHRIVLWLVSVGFAVSAPLLSAAPARPNVLLIICDQMHAGMLSCTGNPWVKTPALDALARDGARFERAYCANPVCVPSRFSMMTGVLPSRIAMESNAEVGNAVPAEVMAHAMGRVFSEAGYKTAYGGKVHLPGGGRAQNYGFAENLTTDQKSDLARKSVEFIQARHDRPFLLVASFINPHDICYMAISAHAQSQGSENIKGGKKAKARPSVQTDLAQAMALPAGVSRAEFFARLCPPLPSNYAIPTNEPDALLSVDDRSFRTYVRQHWSEEDWRLHRWAYARLTESVDAQIGVLLAGLAEAGLDRNTLVVFVSDHGDMDGAHKLEHKSVPYEEAVHVPFLVRLPGVVKAGLVDKEHLVSTGLDLIPSLCDLAGVPIPAGLPGRSVRPLVSGTSAPAWRTTLVVETRNARLAHQGTWKYAVFGTGKIREEVHDLSADPGELENLAVKPAGAAKLEQGRQALKEWYLANGEKLAAGYLVK
jgi:choline-sulfatase